MNDISNQLMTGTVYRVTGPPENFITAMITGYWALNERNVGIWENLAAGDVLLFHSTRKSGYSNNVQSAVIGYARVGSKKFRKSENWWVQEINNDQNIWPYAFSADHICLLQDLSDKIDLTKGIHEKRNPVIRAEVESLAKAGVPISALNEAAKVRDKDIPQFPVNGSMSQLNEIYPELIFSEFVDEWFQCHGQGPDPYLEEDIIGDVEEERLSLMSKEELLQMAKRWVASGPSHTHGWQRTRREDARQKKIVARIEDHTCQVCEFHCKYKNKRGRRLYIIHIDHIVEKAAGGDESLSNLWALCPNCHAKKTAGLLTVDLKGQQVLLNGESITIRDHHLFSPS
jgi:5-methylcytosine-specific restriction endonuclease McrA